MLLKKIKCLIWVWAACRQCKTKKEKGLSQGDRPFLILKYKKVYRQAGKLLIFAEISLVATCLRRQKEKIDDST
jgi:hypothetical protein